MLIIQGDFTVKADRRDEAIQAMIDVAQATQQEAGCIRYNFYADLENPTRFIVYEEWESQAHLDTHLSQDSPPAHMVRFRQQMADMRDSASVRKHQVSESSKL
jgi:quinol monooxygenase YgiN